MTQTRSVLSSARSRSLVRSNHTIKFWRQRRFLCRPSNLLTRACGKWPFRSIRHTRCHEWPGIPSFTFPKNKVGRRTPCLSLNFLHTSFWSDNGPRSASEPLGTNKPFLHANDRIWSIPICEHAIPWKDIHEGKVGQAKVNSLFGQADKRELRKLLRVREVVSRILNVKAMAEVEWMLPWFILKVGVRAVPKRYLYGFFIPDIVLILTYCFL